MGLYINHRHGDIYKNNEGIQAPNQEVFIKNHVAEMIEEQQRVNKSLSTSFYELKNLYEQQSNKQTHQWKDITTQLNQLKQLNDTHDKLENDVIKVLQKLEGNQLSIQKLIEENYLSKETYDQQLNEITSGYQDIADKLERHREVNEKLTSKVEQQTEWQKEIGEKVKEHELSQEKVLERMENQEAITEKITRQMDHFRSILFERTNYLAEKVEEGYHLTTSYVAKLMSDPERPLAYMTLERKNKDKQ
jgi:chromosome segregation ATPase